MGRPLHPTAGAMTIGAGGSAFPLDSVGAMLYIELRRNLSKARTMCDSPQITTRIQGYLLYIAYGLDGLLKTLVHMVGWRW